MTKYARKKIIKAIIMLIMTIIIVIGLKELMMKQMYKKEYAEYVSKYSSEYEIDENLIYALIKVESNFNSNAISRSNAQGLMQLLYSTAEEIAGKNGIELTEEKILEKSEMEAKAVANRIRKLFEDNYCVYDKKEGYRKATFKDIVILLRTTSDTAKVYEKELTQNGFPTFTDTGSNYFETEEIQIILSVLKIIDNPNNDIPLVTVLRSPIGGFTDNELIEIRLEERNGLFYQALETTKEKSQNLELKNKVNKFLNMLNDWQLKQEYLSLDELIWYIYESTNYYNFVSSKPNGELKTANLKLLFEKAKDYEKASFKGLYNFINYIDKISKGSDDMGSAKLIRRKRKCN